MIKNRHRVKAGLTALVLGLSLSVGFAASTLGNEASRRGNVEIDSSKGWRSRFRQWWNDWGFWETVLSVMIFPTIAWISNSLKAKGERLKRLEEGVETAEKVHSELRATNHRLSTELDVFEKTLLEFQAELNSQREGLKANSRAIRDIQGTLLALDTQQKNLGNALSRYEPEKLWQEMMLLEARTADMGRQSDRLGERISELSFKVEDSSR